MKKILISLTFMLVMLFAFNNTVFASQSSAKYILSNENGFIAEFETLEQAENYIKASLNVGNVSGITPFYIPCGPGRHRGPLVLYSVVNFEYDGKVVRTYYNYKCNSCQEVYVHHIVEW